MCQILDFHHFLLILSVPLPSRTPSLSFEQWCKEISAAFLGKMGCDFRSSGWLWGEVLQLNQQPI